MTIFVDNHAESSLSAFGRLATCRKPFAFADLRHFNPFSPRPRIGTYPISQGIPYPIRRVKMRRVWTTPSTRGRTHQGQDYARRQRPVPPRPRLEARQGRRPRPAAVRPGPRPQARRTAVPQARRALGRHRGPVRAVAGPGGRPAPLWTENTLAMARGIVSDAKTVFVHPPEIARSSAWTRGVPSGRGRAFRSGRTVRGLILADPTKGAYETRRRQFGRPVHGTAATPSSILSLLPMTAEHPGEHGTSPVTRD